MSDEIDRPEIEEELIQHLINKTKELVQRDGELFGRAHPLAGYNVDPESFSPSDPILKPRFSGPIKQIRLLLSDREDGSVQIQAHARFPSETRVISLVLSGRTMPELWEYKVFDPKAAPPYTTPIPIMEKITENTLYGFADLVNQAKSGK